MLDRYYDDPNFPTKHLVKDLELFRNEAQTANLESSGIEGIYRLLEITLERGFGESDYSALFEALSPAEG